jgi:tight adherence protein C
MTIVAAAILFVLVVVGVTALGTRYWVRPNEALDRIAGGGAAAAGQMPNHPSLAFYDIIKRVGNAVPASPKDVNVMQRRLIRAGMRGPNALKYLYGAKLLLGILFPVVTSMLVYNTSAEPGNKFGAVLGSVAVGFFGPNEYIRMAARKRQKEISRGLPNALDLMVVCVESGLGLDQAIMQVSKELEFAHPDISEEFALVNLELKAGKRRVEALRNLAERTASEDLKKLVAVLIQADRFGTGIAQSLRAHADYMRIQARQIAEEKAAKLGVKLVFPIFFCILPSLFVVTVGPVVVKIMRELIPMMNNI